MPLSRASRLAAVVVTASLGTSLLQGGNTATHAARGDAMAVRAAAVGRPNIVLVLTDDMRADDVRFMPTVKRELARRGLTFRNSFSPYPLCCPARASLLTGQYAHNHRVLDNKPPFGFGSFDDSRTLATSLQAAGYQSGHVGKYLNMYGRVRSKVTGKPSLRYVPRGWTDWNATFQPPKGSRFKGDTYNYLRTPYNLNGKLVQRNGVHQTVTQGKLARRLVTKYSASAKPFFLLLTPLAPHNGQPREPDDGRWSSPARPPWVRDKLKNVTVSPGLPKGGGPSERGIRDKPTFLRRSELSKAERKAAAGLTRQRGQALLALDRELKKLVATLKRRGEYDDTVLVFTSDNGYLLGEHRIRTGKTVAYEPSIRVPLLLAGPGVPQGVRNDPATTLDVTATVLDLAEAVPPRLADGRSLVSTFGGDLGWDFPVVTEGKLKRHGRGTEPLVLGVDTERGAFASALNTIGLRTARWKYIRHEGGQVELYDLDNDPYELENLAGNLGYTGVQNDLNSLWRQYKSCAGSACRVPLPERFRLDPASLRFSTAHQSALMIARHGVSW